MSAREKEPPLLIDFSDINAKRQFIQGANLLQGLHEVRIKPRKRSRSLDQNAYYWSAFIPPWLAWLRMQEGNPSITAEQAHIALKNQILGTQVITNSEGRTIEVPHTTHDMDTTEFSLYLDMAGKFLAEFAGLVVLPAESFYEDAKATAA
jgi:hypothetical protein